MPRRMINPEIWFNEKVSSLPDAGRLLFIGIFSNADNEGRLKASPKYLKGHIFPYDDDKTLDQIKQLRDHCAELGLIRLYSKDGQEYLDLPGWCEHQSIRKDRYKKSELPSAEDVNAFTPTTVQPISNHTPTDDTPVVGLSKVKRSKVKRSKSNWIPTVSADSSSAKQTQEVKSSKVKPHQKESGAFLSLVEKHEKVPLLNREKLIHLVRTKLFKDARSTPERLFECYLWLKGNDFVCRNKAPPQVICAIPDRYPSWLEGKLKPNVGGKSGEYRRHAEEPRLENKYDWQETLESDDTG